MKPKVKDKIKSVVKKSSFLARIVDEGLFFPLFNNKIKSLKDKFKDERAFIIGNGPSLNKHDLSLLNDEYTFAVNGIFYKTEEIGFKPTFYVVEDNFVMKENLEKINRFECKYKIFPRNYKHLVKSKENTYFFKMDTGYYNDFSPYYCIPRFSPDASNKVYCGQSVTMINIQLAYYMGFSEVYLIGMDHSYLIPKSAKIDGRTIESMEDDPNHFHPDYFGKGKKWHDPHLDRVERNYEYLKLVYEAKNKRLFNATIGGSLEVFERVKYEDLFTK